MNNIQTYSCTVPTLPVLDLSSTGITGSNHIIYNGVTSLVIFVRLLLSLCRYRSCDGVIPFEEVTRKVCKIYTLRINF
jgi:hypothetical protein